MSPGDAGRPVVAHVRDLLFSSRIAETARRLGYPFQAARSLDDLRAALAGRPSLIMLDLTASGLDMDAALTAIEAAGRPARARLGRPTRPGRRPSPSTSGATAW